MPLDVWGAAPGPCQGLCPWTPLGAPPPNPRPLLKKAGENQLEYFFGFPAKYAGPPLMGSGGLVLFVGSRGRKGVADDSFGRQKTATARGGRRRLAARGPRAPGPAKQKSRGRRQSLAPAFQGASRPAAAPRRDPNAFPLPHAGAPPLGLRRLLMGSRGMGRTRGCFPPTPKGSKKGGGQTAPPIRCL